MTQDTSTTKEKCFLATIGDAKQISFPQKFGVMAGSIMLLTESNFSKVLRDALMPYVTEFETLLKEKGWMDEMTGSLTIELHELEKNIRELPNDEKLRWMKDHSNAPLNSVNFFHISDL